MGGRWLVGGIAIATVIVCLPLAAQQRGRPLAPVPPGGQRVAPFFDGWYLNADGTVTFSFGFSNLNREELVEIPLGPDNFIEPKEYDGRQPTSFPPSGAGGEDGGNNRSDRRDRERGVFTVTVPKGFQGDVVWTLRVRGQAYSVPANTKTTAYMLRWPMAMGSIPPLLRFTQGGPAGRGPTGIEAPPMKATVGTALPLTIWITDDSKREPDPVAARQRNTNKGVMNVTWFKHQGPGPVEFSKAKEAVQQLDDSASTTVTSKQPGDYLLRVRADNFGRIDTSAGNQCCWTNGYVNVSVSP